MSLDVSRVVFTLHVGRHLLALIFGLPNDEGGSVVVLLHEEEWFAVWVPADGREVTHVAASADRGCGVVVRCPGSVALGVGKIEEDLIREASVLSFSLVRAGVSVCWVPVPTGHHRGGGALVPAV